MTRRTKYPLTPRKSRSTRSVSRLLCRIEARPLKSHYFEYRSVCCHCQAIIYDGNDLPISKKEKHRASFAADFCEMIGKIRRKGAASVGGYSVCGCHLYWGWKTVKFYHQCEVATAGLLIVNSYSNLFCRKYGGARHSRIIRQRDSRNRMLG